MPTDLEITQAPATPTGSRPRDNGGGASATPDRPAQALRRTITHEGLPANFDIGNVNYAATEELISEKTGKDIGADILPAEAKVVFEKKYIGRKENIGAISILAVKDQQDAIISMTFKSTPWQIGKEVIIVLNKKAAKKGKANDMKARLVGIDWVGVDKSSLTSCCPYLDKMGWFATLASYNGAHELVNMIKALSAEVLASSIPVDFYLGEVKVPGSYKKQYQVILDVLQRRMVIDATSDDDEGAGTQPEM